MNELDGHLRTRGKGTGLALLGLAHVWVALALLINPGCNGSAQKKGDGGNGGSSTADSHSTTSDPSSTSADAGADGAADASTDGGAGGDASVSTALRDAVDVARFQKDLEFIAQPHVPGSAHWLEVQNLCADRFAAYGFSVERQSYATGVNVIGTRAGNTTGPTVLISAHYDHIANCPGADDDGTGVAGVLEVARVFASANLNGTVIVACFDEEERGLVGSRAYATRGKSTGQLPTVMVSFDAIGYKTTEPNSQKVPSGVESLFPTQVAQLQANQYRGDFIGVTQDDSARTWGDSFQAQAISLPVITLEVPAALKSSSMAAPLRRTDHASFWDVGVPAIALSDSADYRNPHYHCAGGPDVVADVDMNFAVDVVRATVGMAEQALLVK